MTVPQTMTFVATDGAGGPEVMRIATGPVPDPKPDEVLIRVLAAGVNRPDVAQRRACIRRRPAPARSWAWKSRARSSRPARRCRAGKSGDRVCALTNGGGYAEYCVAPEAQCLPWPAGYDAVRAGALPENCFTVWANVFGTAGWRAANSLLVHGGTSGIGVTAIQLGEAFGATVYATAGSDAKVRGLPAASGGRGDQLSRAGFRRRDQAADRRARRGRGARHGRRRRISPRNLRCLAMDGRLVQIAFLQGSKVEGFDLAPVMTRAADDHRLDDAAAHDGAEGRDRGGAARERVAGLAAGPCGPVVFASFPLAEVGRRTR